MHHITTAEIHSKQSRGGRINSPELRHSIEQSQDFAGLEEGVNRYDLLLLVKRTKKRAGFTSKMIELLDYYMAYTRDIDWEEGSQPIIYQSLSRTALDMGVSERQIQKLEKSLFEVGALTWNDSGNHRRYGQRCNDTGMILYAYGVDLTPLAYLKAALQEKLHEKQLYDAAWMETKRQISWYRRQISASLAEMMTNEGQGADLDLAGFEVSYERAAVRIRTSLDLEALRSMLKNHKALYEAVIVHMKAFYSIEDQEAIALVTSKSSSKSDSQDIHYKYTKQKPSNKLDTSKATAQCFQESSNENPEPQKGREELSDQLGEDKGHALILKTGLQHITLKQALNASSERFRERLPLEPRPMNWNDFVEAAYKLKSELQISQQSWARACVALGRSGAAVCIILVDQATQRDENRVQKPAAYFSSMITRAGVGELQLHKSIFGLLKQEFATTPANSDAPESNQGKG